MTNRSAVLIPHPTVFDGIFSWTILWLFPRFVRPNHLTIIRFLLVPVSLYLLLYGDPAVALVVFAVAALTDAIDGSLARTRDQITFWGIKYDPVADKLLIGSAAVIVIYRYFGPIMTAAVIIPELLILANAILRKRRGKVMPAHLTGKIKMILQSVSITLLLAYPFVGGELFLSVVNGLIIVSIFFAVLSLAVYQSS